MRGRGYGRGPGPGRGRGQGPFRKGGFRRTAPRQAVLDVMQEADDFLGADEVYMKVYERLPGIGIATVYRTLQLLTELGVLARVSTDAGKARYRLADEEAAAHRVVLVCRSCSRTQTVPTADNEVGERLHALGETIERDYRFAAEQSVHQYYGLCAECSADIETTRGAE